MANLIFSGSGAQTRISPDKVTATGNAQRMIPADPAEAGLAGEIISPDPSTAAGQTVTLQE